MRETQVLATVTPSKTAPVDAYITYVRLWQVVVNEFGVLDAATAL